MISLASSSMREMSPHVRRGAPRKPQRHPDRGIRNAVTSKNTSLRFTVNHATRWQLGRRASRRSTVAIDAGRPLLGDACAPCLSAVALNAA